MTAPTVIVVAGPSGSGKTTWITQTLKEHAETCFYLYPGLGEMPVDLARIGYCYPWVQVLPESQIPLLQVLPKEVVVFLEIGFHLDLQLPVLSALSYHRVAVLPPGCPQSEWHEWADEIIPGNAIAAPDPANLPQLWCTALTGQVFDPPSLDNAVLTVTVQQPGQADAQQQFTAPLKRIVNAGSVGEPRHGRPNATYVLYDADTTQVALREVPYDYQKTCAAIVDRGLPAIFAWRLAQGMEFAERADDPSHVCQR